MLCSTIRVVGWFIMVYFMIISRISTIILLNTRDSKKHWIFMNKIMYTVVLIKRL